MSRKYAFLLVPGVAGLVVDQVSKLMARAWWGEPLVVVPHLLEFRLAENPGAAFSMFANLPYAARMVLFLGFTLAAVAVVVDLFRRLPPDDRFTSLTLGLVASGAVGNAVDRVWKGTVTDFVRVFTDVEPFHTWLSTRLGVAEYPTFNVADVLLGVGVVLFAVHYLWQARHGEADEVAEAG